MRELPITIFRPSIIVGDSETGRTTGFNGLYFPLRLICQGAIKVLPGSRYTPMDVVPLDFVSDAIDHIFLKTNGSIGQTYHLTAGQGKASTTGEIADLAVDYFNQAGVKPHLQRMGFVPLELYHTAKRFSTQGERRVLQAMMAYEPYLCIERWFDNTNTCAALRGTSVEAPPFKAYYQAILRYCIAANWGRRMKHAA